MGEAYEEAARWRTSIERKVPTPRLALFETSPSRVQKPAEYAGLQGARVNRAAVAMDVSSEISLKPAGENVGQATNQNLGVYWSERVN